MRASINEKLGFSNGTYIFNSTGRQINPRDPDGVIIEGLLSKQKETKKANKKQKEKFKKLTEMSGEEAKEYLQSKKEEDEHPKNEPIIDNIDLKTVDPTLT